MHKTTMHSGYVNELKENSFLSDVTDDWQRINYVVIVTC